MAEHYRTYRLSAQVRRTPDRLYLKIGLTVFALAWTLWLIMLLSLPKNQCPKGQGLLFGSICKPCEVEDCDTCESISKCDVCKPGFFEENNTCADCDAHDGLTVCLECKSRDKCTQCAPGYHLQPDGACLACLDSNCRSCDMSAKQCVACKEGFFLDSGVCTPCIDSCLICSDTDKCEACDTQKSYLQDGKCECKRNWESIDGVCTCGAGNYMMPNG